MKNLKMLRKVIFVCLILAVGATAFWACKDSSISLDKSNNSKTDAKLGNFDNSKFSQLAKENGVSNFEIEKIKSEVLWLLNKGDLTQTHYKFFLDNPIQEWFDLGLEAGYAVGGEMGDISTTRGLVQIKMQQEKLDSRAKHRRSSYMFTGGNRSVRVNSAVPPEWKNAISEACKAWNDLGYKISLGTYNASDNTKKTNEIDMTYGIKRPNGTIMPDYVIATTAEIATSGASSEEIVINSALKDASKMSASARKWAIAHELGHAIGLLHTDTNDGMAVDATILCAGSTKTDPNSIMKSSQTFTQAWTGFTTCDKSVIGFYWKK